MNDLGHTAIVFCHWLHDSSVRRTVRFTFTSLSYGAAILIILIIFLTLLFLRTRLVINIKWKKVKINTIFRRFFFRGPHARRLRFFVRINGSAFSNK